jgi:predicted phosphate transport protein (TIGR00153 family)
MFIDRLVRFLLPRQDVFFNLLEEIAAQMTLAATVFGELATASGREQFAAVSARLKPIETEADKACHRLYEHLDRTFVTPIDREDLAHLTKALDDVVDCMEHSAAFAALFRFDALTEPMRQLIRITADAVTGLSQVVGKLRNFSDPDSIRDLTVRVHTLENEADAVYRASIAALFSDSMDPRELVRQKDMLFSLENGVDTCEDAMDVIRSVVVKNG